MAHCWKQVHCDDYARCHCWCVCFPTSHAANVSTLIVLSHCKRAPRRIHRFPHNTRGHGGHVVHGAHSTVVRHLLCKSINRRNVDRVIAATVCQKHNSQRNKTRMDTVRFQLFLRSCLHIPTVSSAPSAVQHNENQMIHHVDTHPRRSLSSDDSSRSCHC